MQGWLSFWFDEKKRLSAAKEFQRKRCAFIERVWEKDEDLQDAGFYVDDMEIEMAIQEYRRMIEQAQSVTELLSSEARFTKELYKYAAHAVGLSGFTRDQCFPESWKLSGIWSLCCDIVGAWHSTWLCCDARKDEAGSAGL